MDDLLRCHARRIGTFDAQSTAADVSQGISLAGRRVIVTGAASGIGIETARALTAIDADVTLAVRDTHAGARVAADIGASTGRPCVPGWVGSGTGRPDSSSHRATAPA